MPPWQPEPGSGDFANDRSLTTLEISTIQEWVATGSAEGDPADLVPPTPAPDGWRLGQPDLIVQMPEAFVVPAGGSDIFRNFAISIPIGERRYVRGLEFRPGNPRVVHHARILIDRTLSSRRLDDRDPRPGYDGMLVDQAQFPDGHFLGWSPGKTPSMLDDGLAWRLDAGTDLVLQLHLLPSGKEERVEGRIGLYFSDTPPTRHAYVVRLGPKTIDIPAGRNDYAIEDRFTLPVDLELRGVYPHAHYLAREMYGAAMLPDGTTRSLLLIKRWDFNWQDEYRYAQPIFLPKGTTLSMRFTYDNSTGNPRNPNRPPKRVVYGGRSFEEMGDLLFQLVPKSEEDFLTLDRAFGLKETEADRAAYEKMLEDDPTDHFKHDALAATLVRLGRPEEALVHFEKALALSPDDPEAHNNLGLLLEAKGLTREAINHYRRALGAGANRLDFAEVHYNLGNALASDGRLPEAIEEYRRAVRQRPEYSEARHNLGSALFSIGRKAEAVHEFRMAVGTTPTAAASVATLAWILATDDENGIRSPNEAVELAERAVELTGGSDPSVLDTLAAAYAATGQFDRAIATAERGLTLLSGGTDPELASTMSARLGLYRKRLPYRESPRGK